MARKCLFFCNARGTRILRDWASDFAWTGYALLLGHLSLPPLRVLAQTGSIGSSLVHWVDLTLQRMHR
jgi:hypothetical protein